MRLFFALTVIIFCRIVSFGQSSNNNQIHVKVLTEARSILHDATVTLLNRDSSVVKSAFTDASGTAVFNNLAAGNYIVRVRLLGFKDHHSPLVDLISKKEHVDTIIMMAEHKVLQDVTVTSKNH